MALSSPTEPLLASKHIASSHAQSPANEGKVQQPKMREFRWFLASEQTAEN
jgi:hypothetical protein